MILGYVGNFRPAHSTETHVAASLEALGHEVIRLQEDEVDFRHVPRTLAERGAAMLLWTRTWHLDVDAQTAMLADLRARAIPSVAFHLDLYVGLKREHQIDDEPWWRCDWVFSADGGHQQTLNAKGVNHRWLRPGIYHAECGFGTPQRQASTDVLWVGNWRRYHAEWPWRRQLVRWLSRTYRGRLRLVGDGRSPPARGRDLADAVASAKVVVGDSCLAGVECCYWSDRVYEIIGRGGLLLHPYVPGLEDELVDGEHYVAYRTGDLRGLKATIDGLLADPDRRAEIAAKGQAKVCADCTYRDRMREMFDILDREEPRLEVR